MGASLTSQLSMSGGDRVLVLWVPGTPKPQGSKTALPQTRKLKAWLVRYGRASTLLNDRALRELEAAVNAASRVLMVESSKGLKDWRADVRAAATREFVVGGKPAQFMRGPLLLRAWFHMPRPLSHYVSGKRERGLKVDAPTYHEIAPDLSKLVRAIEDAMAGVVYADDKQVAALDVQKPYTGNQPGVRIAVSEMEAFE